MSIQSKIDIESNALRILGMLNRFQTKTSDDDDTVRAAIDRVIRDGLLWTSKMIALQLSGFSESNAVDALQLLLSRGLVEVGKNRQWFITFEGRKAYEDEMNSRLMVNDRVFRDEVLTGTDAAGKETGYTWAALPCHCEGGRENSVERKTIEQCSAVERVRCISQRYSIALSDALVKIKTGEIHRCRECGESKLFHRKNGANGQQWQSVCIDCHRKKKAKKTA